MTNLTVTVEHLGAHEPAGDTFDADFGAGLTSALREAGLKRGDGFTSKIVGYTNTSGVSTVYDVEVDGTETAAAAKKTPPKRKSAAVPSGDTASTVDVVSTTDAAEKGTTVGDSITVSEV